MTVATTLSRISYTEDGVSTVFPVPFRFLADADLVVERIVGGVVTMLALTTDYTVSGADNPTGGSITRTAATNGATLRIRRQTPRSQSMVYTVGDDFPAESHERALDRQMLISQEADAAAGDTDSRAYLTPPGEQGGLVPALLLRVGRFFGWDADGNAVASSGTGNDAALRTDLADQTLGTKLVRWLNGGANSVGRSLWDRLNDRVNVKDFGAKCDAVVDPIAKTISGTDDTAAIQKAVDHCLSFARPKALAWPYGGYSKISAPIMIDRMVDTTRSEFHIHGHGGGVVPTGAFNCFDTNITSDTSNPQSEDVVWHDFNWEAPDAAVNAYAMSWKFLRINLAGVCQMRRIKWLTSPHHVQDIRCHHLIAREWQGWLFDTYSNWFDCDFYVRLENAPLGDGFRSQGGGMFGSRLQGLAEGIRNAFWQAGAVKGTIRMYFEGNSGIDLTMTDIANGGSATAMDVETVHVVTGANAANPNYYPIVLGDVRGSKFRCYSNGNLFDDASTPYPLDVSDCYAVQKVYPGAGISGTVKGDPNIRTDLFDSTRTGPTRAVLGKEGYLGLGGWYATYLGNWARFGMNGQNVPFPGYSVCPEGVFGEYVMVSHGPANPQGGYYGAATFKKGDIMWNSKPAAGSPAGWRCTVAGTPGTWTNIPGAIVQADSIATDVPGLLVDFNLLLAKLR